MTDDARDIEIKSMKKDIEDIKAGMEILPDKISSKINENMDLKIKLAISEAEKKYQAKFITLLLGLIGEGIGLIISFFMKLNMGLEERLNDNVELLSGGQRQALTLLMAVLSKPALLLLDEHTAALDPSNAALIMELTKKFAKEYNLTVMMITHNMQQIGIAKIVQHAALDAVEQGVIDAVEAAGFKAVFDCQNANGDVNTANQIASQFKDEGVDVAVGIATPIAIALANTMKNTPIVFGAVTDPVGAGLVKTVAHGDGNITGMSDELPSKDHIKLFKEIAGIKTLGYIYTSNEDNSLSALELVKAGCTEAGLELVVQAISTSSEVKQAAEAIVDRCDRTFR